MAFVRESLKESHSETARRPIDPDLLLRILLIGYLYGITSECKLVEELRMHPTVDKSPFHQLLFRSVLSDRGHRALLKMYVQPLAGALHP